MLAGSLTRAYTRNTEDGKGLEIPDLWRRLIVLYMLRQNEGTDQLCDIAQLICAFVFAYAKKQVFS